MPKSIKFICSKCGSDAETQKDINKSNRNWSVIPPKCKCGGKWDVKVAE